MEDYSIKMAQENPVHLRENGAVTAGHGGFDGCTQLCFSSHELTMAKKKTKREKFLSGLEALVPAGANCVD
jgi:hypothetical protein